MRFWYFCPTVAFAPGFSALSDGQRTLYGWSLFVVASATTVVVAPAAFHRWNFGMGMRRQLLVVTHVMAAAGLVLLACGLVMGLWLISSVVFPDSAPWLAYASAGILAISWIAVPLALREPRTRAQEEADGPD
ncbi:MAG: DUF6328 family protein [Actinomycetota bacterium]|nr:DUF6328 family protein [Actinomycetota bacterium]